MKENESNPAQDATNGIKETDLTQEQALAWLRTNRALLNLKAIAQQLECSPATLTRAVAGEKNSRGYDVLFPKRCLPEMEKIIRQFSQ